MLLQAEKKADLVIKNCKVVNVYTGAVLEKNIALCGGLIAGIGDYEGETEVDANGSYAIPGLIEGHMHIESTFLTPENLGCVLVPHGTTTVIADPHEIVNVCGVNGFEYMIEAAKGTDLDIKKIKYHRVFLAQPLSIQEQLLTVMLLKN